MDKKPEPSETDPIVPKEVHGDKEVLISQIFGFVKTVKDFSLFLLQQLLMTNKLMPLCMLDNSANKFN